MENGGSIGSFDEMAKIKGISKQTIQHLRRFCETQLNNERNKVAEVTSQPVPVHEYDNIDYEIYSKGFDHSDSFILYDEGIPPVSVQTTRPMSSRLHNVYTESGAKTTKAFKLVLDPKLSKYSSIRSFTSIYQDATGISCTRFSANGDNWTNDIKIDAWNYHKVSPIGAKSLCQISDQLSGMVEQLPASDIYILDDHIKAQHFRKPILPKKLSEIVQINQQCAILVALLQQRNPNAKQNAELKQPNVFFMCYNSMVGRLYNLLVGHETASNQSIIESILHNDARNETFETLKIDVSEDIKNIYFKSYGVERECLGKSMLIGLTFIRLGLLKANKKPFTDT